MKPGRLLVAAAACWCVFGVLESLALIPGGLLDEQFAQIRQHFVAYAWSWAGLFSAFAGHVLALAGAATALWLCWRAGSGVLDWLKLKRTGWGKAALAVALGMGSVSLALQGLGLAGLWFPLLFPALGLGLACCVRGPWLPAFRFPAGGSAVLPYLIAAGLAAAFAGTRTPQAAAAVDAMTYHYAAPEHFLVLHKIVAAPWQPQWHLPLLAEMLYGPAFAAGGTEAAKAVDFLMLLACLGGLFWLCAVLGRAAAGWWAAGLFVGLGQVCFSLWQGKNDLAGVVFVLAASGCALRAITGKGRAYWIAAGLCAGWAYAGKPIHCLPVALGLAGAAFLLPAAAAARGLSLALFGSAAAAGGWAVQNFMFTCDPVYPHGFALLGLDAPWWPLDVPEAFRIKLSTPHFSPAAWPEVAAELGGTAWLPVGSLALGCLAPRAFAGAGRKRLGYWLPVVILASGALALAATGTSRYLLPQAGLLCVLAALVLDGSGVPASLRAGFLGVSFLVTFSAIFVGMGPAGLAALRLTGQISREEFQLKTLTSLELMKKSLAGCVPAGKQALFVGEARRLEMPCRVLAPNTYAASPAWKLSRESFSAGEIRKKFRQFNVSCLVYNCVSATYHTERMYPGPVWSERQLRVYREFFASYAELAAAPGLIDRRSGGFYIWSLAARPHAPRRLLAALPGSEGELARTIVLEQGRLDSAWSDLTLAKLMEIREKFDGIGSYHALVGFILRLLGQMEQATGEYEKSLACGYLSENNLTELAALHAEALRLDRARELLEQAAEIYPKDNLRNFWAAYHMTRAYAAGIRRKRMEAIQELDLAAACEPTTVELLLGLAEAYRRLGILFKARAVVGRAVELAPAHKGAAALSGAVEAQILRLSRAEPGVAPGPARRRQE